MCMVDYDDERPTVYRESHRKAKKAHSCSECNRKIQSGEKYHYVFSVFEGSTFVAKTCEHCYIAQNLLARECGGFAHCEVMQDLREHISEMLPWSMTAARLAVGMRRKWKKFFSDELMQQIEI